MINPRQRNVIRQRVHTRIREKMSGTAERPRLNVYRSLNHIYTQLIDDLNGVTIASASSFGKKRRREALRRQRRGREVVGKLIAERAQGEGHQEGGLRSRRLSVSRPREGAADAAREAGLDF
jgi:large subunit ribosomal protein L18